MTGALAAPDQRAMAETIRAVILSFNGREDTFSCLESLQQPTLKPDVVLLADNGGTELLVADLQKRFPGIRSLRLPEKFGFALAW